MSDLFDPARTYVLGDAELDIIADRDKLAQWRHRNTGPAFHKFGRKVVYLGVDLNAWVKAQRVDPQEA